jgi:hypothetical protein
VRFSNSGRIVAYPDRTAFFGDYFRVATHTAAIGLWCASPAVKYYHRMNPTRLGRQFLADLMRLPLIFKLFVLYGVGAAGWKWWTARRQAAVIVASAEWPIYKARVVWAPVSDWRHEGEDGPSYLEGVLTYSYTVPGHDLEVGEYRKRFEDEGEADAWARAPARHICGRAGRSG